MHRGLPCILGYTLPFASVAEVLQVTAHRFGPLLALPFKAVRARGLPIVTRFYSTLTCHCLAFLHLLTLLACSTSFPLSAPQLRLLAQARQERCSQRAEVRAWDLLELV